MVHSSIEYGIMGAFAEGLGILRSANVGKRDRGVDAGTTPLRDPQDYQSDMNLRDIAEVRPLGKFGRLQLTFMEAS